MTFPFINSSGINKNTLSTALSEQEDEIPL
jgi:hypothetical protein